MCKLPHSCILWPLLAESVVEDNSGVYLHPEASSYTMTLWIAELTETCQKLPAVPTIAITPGVPLMSVLEEEVMKFAVGWLKAHPSCQFVVSGGSVPVRSCCTLLIPKSRFSRDSVLVRDCGSSVKVR